MKLICSDIFNQKFLNSIVTILKFAGLYSYWSSQVHATCLKATCHSLLVNFKKNMESAEIWNYGTIFGNMEQSLLSL